jgi:hypothetical protein
MNDRIPQFRNSTKLEQSNHRAPRGGYNRVNKIAQLNWISKQLSMTHLHSVKWPFSGFGRKLKSTEVSGIDWAMSEEDQRQRTGKWCRLLAQRANQRQDRPDSA